MRGTYGGIPCHNIMTTTRKLVIPPCYIRAERLARLELGGYDQVALLVGDGASASGTR